MSKTTKISALSFCFFLFVSTAFAQKAATLVGNWRVDYDACVALLPAEDKAQYNEESEKMLKPMMNTMKFVFDKSGKYEGYMGNNKVTADNATWKLKGKKLALTGSKNGDKELEVKEASKTKLILYDKNQSGFKTLVLVPAQ